MEPKIIKDSSLLEVLTAENCFIAENYSSEAVSVAKARVNPGVTTAMHHLKGVTEIYLITSGIGKVVIDSLQSEVVSGDVVVIPPGVSQKITNVGKTDLIFFCVCLPRFVPECYYDDETNGKAP